VKKYLYITAYSLVKIYWFIFRPKTFGVRCLVESEDGREVLLVKHTYMYRNYWSAPGGKRNKNESLEETAKREIREELGIDIYDARKVGEYNARSHFRFDKVGLFVAKTKDKNFKKDEGEILEAKWFEKNNLPESIFIATRQILEKI